MNKEEVKEKLKALYPEGEDFTVVFSGKKNMKVNGLYKPANREIIIHDGNFPNGNLLMYTAVHELAHHVCFTGYGQNGVKSHTALFWGTFHDLLEKAESAGVYVRHEDKEIKELAEEARRIDREIAKLQRRLGEVLLKIDRLCGGKGIRREDVFEREVKLSRHTADTAIKAAQYDIGEECGQDIQNIAVRIRNEDERDEVVAQGTAGKTIAQIKQGTAKKRGGGTGEEEKLLTEKKRLERTIKTLECRLMEITEKLSGYEGYGNGAEREGARRSADKRAGAG